MTTIADAVPTKREWHSRTAGEVEAELGVDHGLGLEAAEVEQRLTNLRRQ